MSIIYSYPEQGALNANDLLIGTSAEKVGGKQKNITRNFSVQQIADFINRGAGFVDPIASDFQIPVFNQEGKKITGSIMSQNIYPNGSAITIAGSLTTTGNISTPANLSATGVVSLGSNQNLISLNSKTRLNGPILDTTGTIGSLNQILLSDSTGVVRWQNYEAGLTYEGTWDATNNTTNGLSNSPALISGQGVSGHFYIVNVAGSVDLDGNNEWHVGDWAVFLDEGGQAASWQKIDNTSTLVGSGTAGTFAKWTNATTLNDSIMSESGTVVSVDGDLKVKDTVEATTTNSNLKLKGNGTGGVEIMSADGLTDGKIQLNCSDNSHGVTLQSPPHPYTSYTLVLPTTTGNAGDVLTSAGANPSQLVWTPPTAPVTGTGTENYVTKWSTSGTGIEDSTIFDNGTNVGIGTASPDNSLHVLYDDSSLYSENTHNAGIQIENENTTTNTYSQLHFRSGNSDSYIRNITEGSNLSSLSFLTDDGGTTGDVGEVMRLTSSGNVGIGTDSPVEKFVVSNGGEYGLEISPYEGADNVRLMAIDRTTSSRVPMSFDANEFIFQINTATERMRINSAGNVGIGTASPDSKLTVSGAGSTHIKIKRTSSGSEGQFSLGAATNFNSIVSRDGSTGGKDLSFETQGSGTESMRIDSSGNVGIGTTTPGQKLDVSGNISLGRYNGGDFNRIVGLNDAADGYGAGSSYIEFEELSGTGTSGTTKGGNIRFYNHLFSGGTSETLSILANGNVGIGTSSPAVSLDISATDAVQMPVGTTLNRPTTGVSNGMLRYNSSNNGFEGYINGNWGDIGGGSSGGLVFRGTFDASTGAIASGGSLYTCPAGGSGGTVDTAIGDLYIVTTAGSFFCSGTSLNVGDEVICTTAALAGNSQFSYWNAVASGAGGAVTGSGTTNYVPKFTGATVVGNSSIFNDASGNVGIGTSLPAATLDISHTDPIPLRLSRSTTGQTAIRLTNGSSNNLDLTNDGSGNFTIGNGGSERMRIDSSGNVGIGTNSPNEKLDVVGNINISGTGGYLRWNNGDIAVKNEGSYKIGFQTYNATEAALNTRMVLDTNGNVGIGTNSPDTKLHVESTSNANSPILTIENDNAKQIELGVVRSVAGIEPNTSFLAYDNDFRFIAGAGSTNEVMRIDSNGKVGIGTDQPEVSLDLGNTDAIKVPSGPTALRPTGILPGMIRYNTTTSEFEGYSGILNVSGSWGALGGGGTPTITKQLFQVTTAQSIFILTAGVNPQDANYVNIFIDGVYQNSGTYTVATASGVTTVTLNTNAPVGTSVEIISTT